MKSVVVLCAPTGSGKTELTMNLDPDRFEVLSFDSRQVYKELEIGTSKPSMGQRSFMKHHLVDFLEPTEEINTAKFLEFAQKSLQEVIHKDKIPIITCGTGFYLKGFLYGLYPVPSTDKELRKQIEDLSREERWNRLCLLDKNATMKIHYNDDYRVVRALEVILSGGGLWSELKPVSKNSLIQNKDYQIIGIMIDIDRQFLYDRINLRARTMIDGMLQETKTILERHGEGCPALKSLGYNFAVENIKGNLDYEKLYELFAQSHRNYAKKQITWFSKENILERLGWEQALDKIKKLGNR